MKRDYETLDAIVVIGSIVIIGGAVAGLMWRDVPQNNLPIIASLVGTLLGTIVGGYAGFRWGSSIASKEANAAMAQIAGAGPPPPAAPLTDTEEAK